MPSTRKMRTMNCRSAASAPRAAERRRAREREGEHGRTGFWLAFLPSPSAVPGRPPLIADLLPLVAGRPFLVAVPGPTLSPNGLTPLASAPMPGLAPASLSSVSRSSSSSSSSSSLESWSRLAPASALTAHESGAVHAPLLPAAPPTAAPPPAPPPRPKTLPRGMPLTVPGGGPPVMVEMLRVLPWREPRPGRSPPPSPSVPPPGETGCCAPTPKPMTLAALLPAVGGRYSSPGARPAALIGRPPLPPRCDAPPCAAAADDDEPEPQKLTAEAVPWWWRVGDSACAPWLKALGPSDGRRAPPAPPAPAPPSPLTIDWPSDALRLLT